MVGVQTSRSGQGDPRAGEQGEQDQDEWTSQGPGLDPGQRCDRLPVRLIMGLNQHWT